MNTHIYRSIVALFLVLFVGLSSSSILAQDNITEGSILYYGEYITREELQELQSNEEAWACVQIITIEHLDRGYSNDFVCFDTVPEAEVVNQQVRQVVAEYTASHDEASSLRALGHWALYANSLYRGHIGNLSDGQHNPNTYGVWSAWRELVPNTLILFSQTWFMGAQTFVNASTGFLNGQLSATVYP